MSIIVLILVCNVSTVPDACTRDSALSVTTAKATSELDCMRVGQTTIAGTEVKPRPGEEYAKVVCDRSTLQSHRRS
jgi:hypothetical protein